MTALDEAKRKALSFASRGCLEDALWTLIRELRDNPETNALSEQVRKCGVPQYQSGNLNTKEKMRAFIEGVKCAD